MPTRPNIGLYTQPISFIGLPVAAVPLWTSRGLPIGVQIIGPPWEEARVLRVAAYLERAGVVSVTETRGMIINDPATLGRSYGGLHSLRAR